MGAWYEDGLRIVCEIIACAYRARGIVHSTGYSEMFTFFYLSIVFICAAALARQDTKCFDDVAVPPEYGSTFRLLRGDYFFPDLTFNCGGTIKNITMGVDFIEDYRYSSVLTANVSLWSKNGSKFQRVIEKKDHVIPLKLNNGDYSHALKRKSKGNVRGRGVTEPILFPDVDIRVEEGEILGLSLPIGSNQSMVTGITVAVNENYSNSPIVTVSPVRSKDLKGCWSMDGFVTPCQVHGIVAYGKPFIMFGFVRDSMHVPEPDTSSDSETGFQINGPIATVFAVVLGTLACASLVLLAAFLSVSLCCKQNREKGVVEFREPYVTMKSIELAGDNDVKPTARDPEYDYAQVTIVRVPTKPSTMGLSPETHSYSHLRQENGTTSGENSGRVTTPGGGGGYDSIDQSAQYLNTSINVTNPGPDKQPQI